jgi:heat shock protein HslJ
MNRRYFIGALLLISATVLAGCIGGAGATTEKTVFVGPCLVDCVGVAPQKCMLVKESPDSEYTLFYDQIEGFTYEEGYEYELVVEEEKVENPPADASAIKWTLVEQVSKTEAECPQADQPAQPAEPGQASDLSGTQWSLISYLDPEGSTVGVIPDTEVTAEFTADQVSGTAGCNRYFGGYQVDGNKLTVDSAIGQTEMFCGSPDGVMKQEQDYLAALSSAATYQIAGDQLQIANAEGATILTYGVLESAPVTATTWLMTSYNNGKGGVVSALADTDVTAVFGEDGNVRGSAGCNRYTAPFEVEGDTVTIGMAGTTRMMCAEPVMEQENAYLAALSASKTFKVQGDQLELRDGDGSLMAKYVETDEAVATEPPAPTTAPTTAPSTPAAEPTKEAVQAEPKQETDGQMTGVVWYWQGTKTPVDDIIPDDPSKYTIEFLDDGRAFIRADCNSNQATYTVDGSNIQIELGPMTMVQCPKGSYSDQFLKDLDAVAIYFFEGENLFIDLVYDSGTMVFSPDADKVTTDATAQDASGLVGVVWNWQGTTTPTGDIVPDDPSEYTIEFRADGTAAIHADCNNNQATYTTDGSSIQIELGPMTMVQCPKGSYSDQFLKDLDAAAIYNLGDGNLFIDLYADGGTMFFSPGG